MENLQKYFPFKTQINYYTAGQIGPIYEAKSKEGNFIIKTSAQNTSFFEIEAKQLEDLAKANFNTPKIVYVDKRVLILEKIANDRFWDETIAAKEIAKLHLISNNFFGYFYDTPLASFWQKNSFNKDFCTFFINQRLLPMFQIAHNKVTFSIDLQKAFKKVLNNLQFCQEDIAPALIHGDLWSGNIIFSKKELFFIDPALYFADSEVELSFIAMFSTFSNTFFKEYQKYKKISPLFWSYKLYFYQLYPILVHIALYGSSYLHNFKFNLKKLLN